MRANASSYAALRRGVLLAGQRLVVVAIRVGVLAELLVRARDVEDHVAVRREAIRREEVLEGAAEVSALVPVGADLELQLRLVGEVVGRARGLARERSRPRRRGATP